MYPSQHSRDTSTRCRPLSSAVFTGFLSAVFMRYSQYAAQYRLPALMLVYSAARRSASHLTANLDLFGWEVSAQEKEALDAATSPKGHPSFMCDA